MPLQPLAPPRARKGVLILAVLLLSVAACPQANAADSTRPPDTVRPTWQPSVPYDDSGSPGSTPHQETHAAQTVDDDTGRAVKVAVIGTVVTIIVAAGICIATSGALCMFPVGF